MGVISLDGILGKALQELPLTREEILYMLKLKDQSNREKVFSTARELRKRYFDNKVFLYGFVYFSTYCRNDCTFCYYRKSNDSCRRYRKSTGEIVKIAEALADTGVHLIDLTMGEDPEYLSKGNKGYKQLVEIVHMVKENTGLPVMVSPGVVPADVLTELKKAGADWYACYQETHNREVYRKLRLNQSYEERWTAKVFAKTIGLLVEEGLLVGIGDTEEDAADSFIEMRKLGAEQIRTMSFVPQEGTPLYGRFAQNDIPELNVIAVMRILFPDRLIPASLDVEGIKGLKERLDAGANVVTSIIPPEEGLVGVSQSTLDVAEGNRTVRGIIPALKECGLKPASADEYRNWVCKKQGNLKSREAKEEAACELQ